jgi:hypothetical protein
VLSYVCRLGTACGRCTSDCVPRKAEQP